MLNKKRSGSPFFKSIIAIAVIAVASSNIIMLQSCKPERYALTQASKVDQPASFKGDVYRYLGANLKYPEAAIEQKIEGCATIKFIVDHDGKVLGQSVVRSSNDLLSAAALKVVNEMPAWLPAKKNGKSVAVEYYLPVWFTLDKMVINMFSMTYREVLVNNQRVVNGQVARVSTKLVKNNARAEEFEAAKMIVANQGL